MYVCLGSSRNRSLILISIFPEYRMGLGFVGLWNGANEFLAAEVSVIRSVG